MSKSQQAPFLVFCLVALLCAGVMLSSNGQRRASVDGDPVTSSVQAEGSPGGPSSDADSAFDPKDGAIVDAAAGGTGSAGTSPSGDPAADGSAGAQPTHPTTEYATSSPSAPGYGSAPTSAPSSSGPGTSSPSGASTSSPASPSSPSGTSSSTPSGGSSGSPTSPTPPPAPAEPPVVDLGSLPSPFEGTETTDAATTGPEPGGSSHGVQPQGSGDQVDVERSVAPSAEPTSPRETDSSAPEPVTGSSEPATAPPA